MVPTPALRQWAGSGEGGQHPTRTPAVRAITFTAEALTRRSVREPCMPGGPGYTWPVANNRSMLSL